VDQQLVSLLGSFWTTSDPDAARVLADRLTEMPAEDVAAALIRFRVLVQVTPAMIDAGRAAFDDGVSLEICAMRVSRHAVAWEWSCSRVV